MRERSADMDVPFTACDHVACTGTSDGAAFEIVMPRKWNGTLLLYSHGYRQLKPAPPDFAAPATTAEPAPGWPGQRQVGETLLEQGYAIAGSAYSSNGWAVAEGISAGEALHQYFTQRIGTPDRTYVWGDSLGGLVTQMLAERHPEWVSGAAPMCGVLGGPVPNLNLALDVAYGIKTLIDPSLQLTGYASWDEAVHAWEGAYQAVTEAGRSAAGAAEIMMVGDLVDAPTKTSHYDGATLESQVRARAEAILTALGYGTFGRYDIEQRAAGNPSGNAGTDYRTRVSDAERTSLETIAPGSTARMLAALGAGKRIDADPVAADRIASTGTPTGAVKDPEITMHTEADPLVLVQNETLLRERATASKQRTADLVQLYVAPPATFSSTAGAPYGAGHCNFTPAQRVGLVSLLDGWVRHGVFPGPGSLASTFRAGSPGSPVTQAFDPGPWPAQGVR